MSAGTGFAQTCAWVPRALQSVSPAMRSERPRSRHPADGGQDLKPDCTQAATCPVLLVQGQVPHHHQQVVAVTRRILALDSPAGV